ncbi:unnamed protein product [Ixodes persulcatus]
MRLAISYLRMHEILEPIVELKEEKVSSAFDASVLEALDGFLVVLSADGDVLFLSENISRHLGLNQVDLMGQSLFEFCHPCDHDELKEVLCPGGAAKAPEAGEKFPQPCSFFVRLRCALGSKGRGVGVKSASSYKVLHCVGHRVLRDVAPSSHREDDPEEEEELPEPTEASPEPCGQAPAKEQRRFVVCVAQPIPHPSNIEVPLGSRTFLSRHSPSMRFTHVDDRIEKFLGYTSDELLGKSVYSYFDARDISALQKDFKTLFSKGQCETGQYRFLSKHGGYVWVLTQATLIYENNSCSRPQCVVCVNYVLSGTSQEHEVVSEDQVIKAAAAPEPPEKRPLAPPAEPFEEAFEAAQGAVPCYPVASSTAKIFAPRTADMNKGFLMFADDDSGLTVLKEDSDPEDLTHLAPQAGDDSIPLEELPSDVLGDTFVLSDPYGDNSKLLPDYALLPPEEDCPLGHRDPFLSYRDDKDPLSSPDSCGTPPASDCEGRGSGSCSDSLLSDVPSLESPVDRFAGLDLRPEGTTDLQEDEFDMRAPYISMSGDDFPLLSPPDSVMWGPQDSPQGSTSSGRSSLCDSPTFFDPPVPPRHAQHQALGPNPDPKSSLAALLVSPELPPPPRPRDWGRQHRNPRQGAAATQRATGVALSRPEQRLGRHAVQRNASMAGHGRASDAAADGRRHGVYVTAPLEQKMAMPSPPEPPPKRSSSGGGGAGALGSPKRMRVDPQGLQLQNKDSVLLNLLVNGEDASHGYLCQTLRYDRRFPAPSPCPAPLLLDEPIPSLQDLSQLDAEVNAPIQQLLTGEDLLNALDQSVPALV